MNEEKNIRRCLESLKWCDEIIVVDSGSTDNTLAICREYNTKIFQREWPGFVEQKRFALGQCSHEWVLNLDSDEEVSVPLREEIIAILSNSSGKVPANGYYISRVVFYMNRWWRRGGWYPEYRLRLLRRACTTWGGDDPHDKACVTGSTARLVGELNHFTYDDIGHHVRSLNSHSTVAARTMHDQGVNPSLVNLAFNPLVRFIKFYIFKKGFLEGLPGVIVAVLESYYVFLKYAKLWEIEHRNNGR